MAPVLAPLPIVLSRAGIDAAVIPSSLHVPNTQLFAVVASGDFGGRRYVTGEVLVCAAGDGAAPVVLAARGPGRPMLGRVDAERLFGDAGEPCSAERWSVAGRVERVLLAGALVAEACARFGRVLGSREGNERPTGAGGGTRHRHASGSPRAVVALGASVGTRRPALVPSQLALFSRAA